MSKVKHKTNFDFLLLIILIGIAVSSLLAIGASSPLLPSYLNANSLIFKQLQFYIIGVIIIFSIMYLSNDDSVFILAKIGYGITLALLIYLFIDILLQKVTGSSVLPLVNRVNGATCWLSIPILGSIQPSEFMKIFIVVICANTIKDHNDRKTDDSFESDIELFKEILKWVALPLILILLQPDTGIFMIICFSIFIMVICSGIRKEWIIYSSILIILALFVFFYLYYFQPKLFPKIFGKGYKVRRFYGWLEPEKYKNSDGLQLYSALLSIGSAGFGGHGFRTNIIPIPEAHTDFIFAIIGMNFGFIGTFTVIILCALLDLRLAIIALNNQNKIEKLSIIGFLAILIIQQLENIGMVIGFFPITGVTLPLISYGGSSLLSYMIAFGIIFNSYKNTVKNFQKL